MGDLLCVGDTVEIHKPDATDRNHWFWWSASMDKYDGGVATVAGIIDRNKDDESKTIPAYDLNIDAGEFGWLESWLTKIDT